MQLGNKWKYTSGSTVLLGIELGIETQNSKSEDIKTVV